MTITTVPHENDDHDVLVKKLSRRLLPIIVLLVVLNYLDRSNLGFAALQMNEQLGFSPKVFGIGASFFFVGYVLSQIPATLLIERVGPSRVIAVLAVSWGLVAASMAFISGTTSFYTLRFLLAITEAALIPGATLYIAQWFPARGRSEAMSYLYLGTMLAFVVGGPVSGALLELPPMFGLAPWQIMFIVEALPAVILGFFVVRLLPDTPEAADWLSPDERAQLSRALAAEHKRVDRPLPSTVAEVLGGWRIWVLVLTYLCIGANFLSMVIWLPQIVKHMTGLRPIAIGFVTAAPFLLGAILMILMGRWSDRVQARGPFVVVGNALGGVGFALSAYCSSQPVLALVFLTLGFGILTAMNGPFWTFVGSIMQGRGRAVAIGLLSAVGSVGGFLSTRMLGYFREELGNYQAGLYVMAGLLLLSAALMWVASRDERTLLGAPART